LLAASGGAPVAVVGTQVGGPTGLGNGWTAVVLQVDHAADRSDPPGGDAPAFSSHGTDLRLWHSAEAMNDSVAQSWSSITGWLAEHLPPVRIFVADMHPVWAARRDALQVRIASNEELFRLEAEITAPRELVWAYFVQPEQFNVLLGGDRTAIVDRKRGRVAVGSAYQCYHGDSYVTNVVVGWHPFDSAVVEFTVPTPIPGAICRVEMRLDATERGTRLAEIVSRSTGPLLARLAADAGMKARRDHVQGLIAAFKAHVEAELAERTASDHARTISSREVESAARAALVDDRQPGEAAAP